MKIISERNTFINHPLVIFACIYILLLIQGIGGVKEFMQPKDRF
jgi:hypothetical protein